MARAFVDERVGRSKGVSRRVVVGWNIDARREVEGRSSIKAKDFRRRNFAEDFRAGTRRARNSS